MGGREKAAREREKRSQEKKDEIDKVVEKIEKKNIKMPLNETKRNTKI